MAAQAHSHIAAEPAGSLLWDTFRPYVARDEKILWVGRPDPTRHLGPADRFLIPFSILWFSFAVVWEAAVIAGGGGIGFAIFGLPFVVFGTYFTVGRFIAKTARKRRTAYAVTDKRVLDLYRGRSGANVNAGFISAIPAVNRRLRRDGSGTVVFGNRTSWYTTYANTGLDFFGSFHQDAGAVAFYDIPDANSVAEMVEELRARR